MIVDQGALCGDDSLLYGLELDRDVGAGPFVLDHVDDVTQMTISAFQSLDDTRMGCVLGGGAMDLTISPLGGYGKAVLWQLTRECSASARLSLIAGHGIKRI